MNMNRIIRQAIEPVRWWGIKPRCNKCGGDGYHVLGCPNA